MPHHATDNSTAIPGVPHRTSPTSRREFLTRSGGGFGALAFSSLMSAGTSFGATAAAPISPLASKPPHYRARAKSVIFLFMEGGPSHIDLFDPKPRLNELAGKPLPDSFGN